MSVIAIRDGVIAADMAAFYNSAMVPFKDIKLFKSNNRILGGVGNTANTMKLIDHLAIHVGIENRPSLNDNSTVIVFDGKGVRIYEQDYFYDEINFPFMAYGAGIEPALGVMYAGATAIKAVEIASKVLPGHCGNGVMWYNFNDNTTSHPEYLK